MNVKTYITKKSEIKSFNIFVKKYLEAAEFLLKSYQDDKLLKIKIHFRILQYSLTFIFLY